MIIAIGYHSSVDFYQQLHSRGLPEPGKNVAVLSAMSELAKARDVDHVIIFDTPYVLARVSNAYCFDFKIIKKSPLTFQQKTPIWSVIASLRVQPSLGAPENSELNVTQQIIDAQRHNDVIDKINRLKEFLPSDRMDRVIVAYAKFLKTNDIESLKKTLMQLVAKNKQRDACMPVINDIISWSVSPAAIRLIAAMKEVGSNWRNTYEKISLEKGIRPFELSFFLVAYERSSDD